MLGLVILVLTVIGTRVAALSILGDEAITLLDFIFVPVVAGIVAVWLIAAWSINRLQWPQT